jgi:hypothetical protein
MVLLHRMEHGLQESYDLFWCSNSMMIKISMWEIWVKVTHAGAGRNAMLCTVLFYVFDY